MSVLTPNKWFDWLCLCQGDYVFTLTTDVAIVSSSENMPCFADCVSLKYSYLHENRGMISDSETHNSSNNKPKQSPKQNNVKIWRALYLPEII